MSGQRVSGEAAELALHALETSQKTRALRDRLEVGIRGLIPEARLNGHRHWRLPNILNLTLPGLRGESVVVAMDKAEEEAHCSVRFSLSHGITEADTDDTVAALKHVLTEMETTVRFLPCK